VLFGGEIDSVDLDIAAIVDESFSPAARSAMLAEFSRETLADAEKTNSDALGFIPEHVTTVDGTDGVDEDMVRPDGTIAYAFSLSSDVFPWIARMLRQFAPVRSGRFKSSFELFADGVVIDPDGVIPQALEFVFESVTAYASKIEGESKPPESKQAPNGVFEAVATLAQIEFGSQANISFSYRAPLDGSSEHLTPAITVTLGS
jgi:hypothetical protein